MTFWPLRPGLHVIFIDILGSLFLAAWRTWRAAWRLRTGYTPCKWIYNHSIPWSTIVYHGCRGYKPTYGLHFMDFMVFFYGFLWIFIDFMDVILVYFSKTSPLCKPRLHIRHRGGLLQDGIFLLEDFLVSKGKISKESSGRMPSSWLDDYRIIGYRWLQ